jgi:RNA polymerase sigma factor (sigma-70 family)
VILKLDGSAGASPHHESISASGPNLADSASDELCGFLGERVLSSKMTTDDIELLRRYVAERSEASFTDLVQRHINLVYSAALRQVHGDVPAAQDVTQAVFADLARKAPRLVRHTSLTGWLYTSTRYLAANARRTEQRRHAREQEAHAMNQLLQSPNPDPAWQDLQPVLDDVMHELSAADREAVLLRYFERRPLAEVGTRLGLSENAARMRVDRALDKLRASLAKRGLTSTVGALAMLVAERAVGVAPAAVAAQVSRAAFLAGVAGGGSIVSLFNLLASAKATLLVGAAVVAVAATCLLLPKHANNQAPTANAAGAVATADQTIAYASPATDTRGNVPASVSAGSTSTSNKLVLTIVAADRAEPVPMVTIDCDLSEGTNYSQQQFVSTRFGVCEIPVPRATVNRLFLHSQAESFADAWLQWRLDRGDTIPEEYTLRLARAVQIGGQVVDEAGQPVAGAGVAFGAGSMEALFEARPETHAGVGIVAAPTDSAGRWSLNRIAPELLQQLGGMASHPEHVSTQVSFAGDPVAQKELLAGTHVFRLGRAVAIRGIVLDSESQPVPEAKLRLQSRPGAVSEFRRPATNQADGTFILTGCAPGTNKITVEAAAFSPAQVEVYSETNSPPLRIILQRGKVLRLRVVDQARTPVPRAVVEFTDSRTSRVTDAEGRLQWDGAAAEDVPLVVRADGYIWTKNVTAKADGQEHLITLSPSLTISGTVRDAVTGQPVPHFRIIPGWPRLAPLTHTTNFQWQSIGPTGWTSSAEGKFRQTVGEAVSQDTELVFKFDAEGYAPFVTRVVRSDEGEAQFDVALRPAPSVTVTVLLPDGNPAVNADVHLVLPGVRGIQRGVGGKIYPIGKSLLTTDEQGRFGLEPDDEVTGVIVANQNGYGEATRAALAADPVIRLQPWGRIEGTILSGGRSAAGRAVQFLHGSDLVKNTAFASLYAYQAKTDDDGRFVFAQVPPGKHTVAQSVPQNLGSGRGGMQTVMLRLPQMSMDVEVRPGQTATVTLGNSNYTVTARLRWPADLKREPAMRIMLSLQRPTPVPPAESRNNRGALAAWRAQPEIAAAYSAARPLVFSEEADGTFVADNVPPGSFNLVATIAEFPSAGGPPKPLAQARVPVTVPADPPSGTLDLGEIVLKPVQ